MRYPKAFLDYLRTLLQNCPLTYAFIPESTQNGTRDNTTLCGHFYPDVPLEQSGRFNRLATTLYAKFLLSHPTDASYHLFTEMQPSIHLLTRETYDNLASTMFQISHDEALSRLLDTYLIIRQYALTEEARTRVRALNGEEISSLFPMEVTRILIDHKLPFELQKMNLAEYEYLRLAATADFSVIGAIDGEIPPISAKHFEDETDTRVRNFALTANLCEIAGHSGAYTQYGSAFLDEQIATDYLTIMRFATHRGVVTNFYREEATKLLFGTDFDDSEAIAGVRLSRLMGEPTEAKYVAEYLTHTYPKYDKIVHELNLGFPWNTHGDRPIVYQYGRSYLGIAYQLRKMNGSQLPLERTMREELPLLINQIKALRRASLLNPPRADLLYLDLSEDARLSKKHLREIKKKML